MRDPARLDGAPISLSDLQHKRLERLREVIREAGTDHVLLSSFDNCRWAADLREAHFAADSNLDFASLLVDGDARSVVIDPAAGPAEDVPYPDRPWIARRIPGPSWQSFWSQPDRYASVLAAELERLGARRVGLDFLHFEVFNALSARLPGTTFVPVADDLARARLCKLPEEVALMAASSDISSKCADALADEAEPGMTDDDLAALIARVAFTEGAESISHLILTLEKPVGHASWFPEGKELAKSETMFLDFGVYGPGGYCSDLARTHFVGEPNAEVARVHGVMDTALAEGVSMARAGARCGAIAETIDAAMRAGNVTPAGYSYGHGIGLRLIERPSFPRGGEPDAGDRLLPGMVICIELGAFLDEDGIEIGVGLEDQFVVEETGLRCLTTAKRPGF